MIYLYRAKNFQGEMVKGEIDASGKNQAIKILKERNLIVLDLNVKKRSEFIDIFEGGINLKEKFIFTKQLTVMIKSGLSLIDALDALREQTSNKKLSGIASEISVGVRGGKSFSDCLKAYPKVFSPIFINSVSSGEKSGKLDEMLERLSVQMEKDYDLQSKVTSAMMYPIIILVAILGVMFVVLFYIMPQVQKIFNDMNVSLPLITRIILGLSAFVNTWWWAILIVIATIYFIINESMKLKEIRYRWDVIKLKIPVYGPFIKKLYMARFTRNMSTLISSGLSMIEAIEYTKGMMNNLVYQESMGRVATSIEGGLQLSGALKLEKDFPIMVAQMITVGEKSGKIDYVLNTLADFFDREVESTTKNLTTILEPIITVCLGVAVALVVASVIMPIYGLVNAI